jgi:SAM-dependent methyltransferase
MRLQAKVCDAADWFGGALLGLIRSELRELPRFHRKQWEFAMILRALRAQGVLREGRSGLSMGGGRERLLYAVARHVDRLVVTDLYDAASDWEDARTDDPDDFVKAQTPFPVDPERIDARRMDMRELRFGPGSFDFCYSSCAIEHIGGRDDFLGHLREVHRVLKEGGLYVLTTEFHYGPDTIELPGNYLFSGGYLSDLFADSPFAVAPVFDARLARHRANLPLPGNLSSFYPTADSPSRRLMEELPHLQLLRGTCPFTSALFVLRKTTRGRPVAPMEFRGLPESRTFLAQGVEEQRALLESASIALAPFAFLPGGRSAFVAGQASREASPMGAGDGTAFHTDYVWLGSGPRALRVTLAASPAAVDTTRVELRIHRVRARGPFEAECAASEDVVVAPGARVTRQLSLALDENWCYAVLGKVRAGSGPLDAVEVLSRSGA